MVAQLKQLQSETEPIVKMFEDPETQRQMQSTRSVVIRLLLLEISFLFDLHGCYVSISTHVKSPLPYTFHFFFFLEMGGCCLNI